MLASDIIIGINGQTVKEGDQLVQLISAAQPGSSVDLKVLREGKTVTVPVKIGDRAEIIADNAMSRAIASVEPGSFAEDIGLQKGDVLVEINRHRVATSADVKSAMQSAKPGEAMAFKMMRNTGGNWTSLFAAGTVPQQ